MSSHGWWKSYSRNDLEENGHMITRIEYADNLNADPHRETTCGVLGGDIPPLLLPVTSRDLPLALGGSHWCGPESFENIVVFGASYCKRYMYPRTNAPGSGTWVDQLEMRWRNQNINPAKIHNLAFPGATAQDDLSHQLSHFFRIFPQKESPNGTPPLDPDRTTYFIFMGINDCGRNESFELGPIVEGIFDAVRNLYVKAGARNFILIDIPPVDRSPQAVNLGSSMSHKLEERIRLWNDLLREQITEFGSSSKEATIFLFSSHQVLTEVLDDPSKFNFSEDDTTTEGGGIWDDGLHLTTDVHNIITERLLASVFPPSSAST